MISHTTYVSIIAILYLLYSIRSNKVSSYRGDLLLKMSKAMMNDINHHRPSEWRLELYDSVTKREMMLKFWIPVKRFYREEEILSPFPPRLVLPKAGWPRTK